VINANKAAEITEKACIKKRADLYLQINDKILKAVNAGLSSCHIDDSPYFDDTIKHTLNTAGYKICHVNSDWGGFYKISWSDNKC